MLTCKETSQLISQAQERKLGLRERFSLRIHLWVCSSCSHFEKQIKSLRSALKKHSTPNSLPDDKPLPGDARERILNAIRNQTSE